MDLDLKDNIAAVTRGSEGIGLATACRLRPRVFIWRSARDAQRVREVAHELSVEFVGADILDARVRIGYTPTQEDGTPDI